MNNFNKKAFANSIAVTTGFFYIILYIIALISPSIFRFIFDAQFLGAGISALIPTSQLTFGSFIITLIVVIISTWIVGYTWASLYNKFSR